ncbi:FUSC family protein [Chryseobacterium elymi]|uniref:FUSC family protein n=1 Tax=Chryseobacterium elymi TaxID=395936 RepID=A0A3D9DML3_9FLAO|nr:FUSC family protein [Chryseobacterium elymi]REC79247.1 FUSC family protein [Chryseobacterium elymi]
MEKELTELTDQELLEKRKKNKSNDIMNAVILGVLIGIAIYSTLKYGLGLFTFLPLLFVLYAVNKWNKSKKALEEEINARNLK